MKKLLKRVALVLAALIVIAIVAGATFILTFKPAQRPAANERVEATPARLARGRYLAAGPLGCISCHSQRDETRYGRPVNGPLGAGGVCFTATLYMKRALGVDDSLDVFPVHGVGGMTGTLLAGVFASNGLGAFSGQGYSEGMTMGSQLAVQAQGVLSVAAYTAVVTFVLLKAVDFLTGLRVSAEAETMGLDTAEHNERGYNY